MLGEFKLLEKGMGMSGYSAPSFLDKMSVGSFGGISDMGKKFAGGAGNLLGKASSHFSDNKDLYNFGANALQAGGNYMLQNRAADEAKKMNKYYVSQFEREKKRQEEAETALTRGFNNSGFGQVRAG